MRRGPLVCAILAVALLALVACDGEKGVESTVEVAPEAGACRLLDRGQLREPADLTEPVPCNEPHTTETFWVGEIPATTGADYSSRAHGVFAHDTCAPAFAKFLGADESLVLRARLSWAWFRPSRQAWAEGARWLRCDAVGGRSEDKALRPLPTTAKGLLAKEEVSAWMSCAKGTVLAEAEKVPCDKDHDWRAVTAVKIGTPNDPYPGDRVSEVRARDTCSDWVGAWLNYALDYEYGYSIFHEAEWKAGNRRAVCWARTAK